MARKGDSKLSDPIGGVRQVNVMESGLIHCGDSLSGGRDGTFIQRFGHPGDPLERSAGVSGDLYGRTPDVQAKFIRKGQR